MTSRWNEPRHRACTRRPFGIRQIAFATSKRTYDMDGRRQRGRSARLFWGNSGPHFTSVPFRAMTEPKTVDRFPRVQRARRVRTEASGGGPRTNILARFFFFLLRGGHTVCSSRCVSARRYGRTFFRSNRIYSNFSTAPPPHYGWACNDFSLRRELDGKRIARRKRMLTQSAVLDTFGTSIFPGSPIEYLNARDRHIKLHRQTDRPTPAVRQNTRSRNVFLALFFFPPDFASPSICARFTNTIYFESKCPPSVPANVRIIFHAAYRHFRRLPG